MRTDIVQGVLLIIFKTRNKGYTPSSSIPFFDRFQIFSLLLLSHVYITLYLTFWYNYALLFLAHTVSSSLSLSLSLSPSLSLSLPLSLSPSFFPSFSLSLFHFLSLPLSLPLSLSPSFFPSFSLSLFPFSLPLYLSLSLTSNLTSLGQLKHQTKIMWLTLIITSISNIYLQLPEFH